MQRPLLLLVVVALLGAACAPAQPAGIVRDPAPAVGGFTLPDSNGVEQAFVGPDGGYHLVYFGFTISLFLHASILAWALVNIQATPPFKDTGPEPVEVAIITPEDLVRLKQGNRRSKALDAKQSDVLTKGKETKKKAKPKVAPAPAVASAPPPEPPPPEEPREDEIALKLDALQNKQALDKKLE